ncbi:hypothetical protein ACVJBD_000376 [Rhizobium mongolense]
MTAFPIASLLLCLPFSPSSAAQEENADDANMSWYIPNILEYIQ